MYDFQVLDGKWRQVEECENAGGFLSANWSIMAAGDIMEHIIEIKPCSQKNSTSPR